MIRKNVWQIVLALPGILFDVVFLSGIIWLLGPLECGVAWNRVFFSCIPGTLLLFWWDDTSTSESWTTDDARWVEGSITSGGGHLLINSGMSRGPAQADFCTQLLTAVLLLGPRMLRGAIGKLRVARRFGEENCERAEQVLRQIAAVDHAVAVRSLVWPQEQLVLLRTLAYLRFYGWIEASEDTERVWLPAEIRSLMEHVPG
ncbi:MAG: hypothetical protein ABSH20_16150 [Tepidisphaeraceae bacterium]|jgi:hypothetical protein